MSNQEENNENPGVSLDTDLTSANDKNSREFKPSVIFYYIFSGGVGTLIGVVCSFFASDAINVTRFIFIAISIAGTIGGLLTGFVAHKLEKFANNIFLKIILIIITIVGYIYVPIIVCQSVFELFR